jgi:hypothetical protein
MPPRDPKTGKFVKVKYVFTEQEKDSLREWRNKFTNEHEYPKEKVWEKSYGIKTRTNYWNYLFVGVFGLICILIGYELGVW